MIRESETEKVGAPVVSANSVKSAISYIRKYIFFFTIEPKAIGTDAARVTPKLSITCFKTSTSPSLSTKPTLSTKAPRAI